MGVQYSLTGESPYRTANAADGEGEEEGGGNLKQCLTRSNIRSGSHPSLRGSFHRCIVDFKSACFFLLRVYAQWRKLSGVATVGPGRARPHQTLLPIGIHNSEDNRQLLLSRCRIFRARLPERLCVHVISSFMFLTCRQRAWWLQVVVAS